MSDIAVTDYKYGFSKPENYVNEDANGLTIKD